MTSLPPIPKGRIWSPETWRAGLDEAVRRAGLEISKSWQHFARFYHEGETAWHSIIAHATTLLDAGIVKPVVSEAAVVWQDAYCAWHRQHFTSTGNAAAIAVIQSALDKARAGI